MEDILIKATARTPYVNFNSSSGRLELRGRSIPENAPRFYEPLFKWIKQYANNPAESTSLIMVFDYFNTSSSKMFRVLFEELEVIFLQKHQVEIKWYYSDEDLKEYGEDLLEMLQVPVRMIFNDTN